MLLEGEGYILATFFAVLIPVYLLAPAVERPSPPGEESPDDPAAVPVVAKPAGKPLGERFRQALLLNLQGSVWVALVLAAAALYEATELILMMR
jgi:hypothetical protein